MLMTKTLDEPLEIIEDRADQPPRRFLWRQHERHLTACGAHWTQRGRWWLGESPKAFFRITTLDNITLDLCLDKASHTWTVARIWD